MRRLPQAPLIRTSLATLAIAVVFFIVSLARAVRIAPVEAAPRPASSDLVRSNATVPPPEIDLGAVGANGIFQPDRTALPYRYRMPGESAPNDSGAPDPLKPVVLGTVIATDGSNFATCQMPGGRPTVLRVGDTMGDYTVTAIEREKVVFKNGAGKLMEITVTRPGT
jgi:hypothetical protein